MRLRTNSAYNLVGALAPMIVAVLTVPPYLRIIGLERYGVMSLFWVVLTYFGLFDLGLGRAVSQRLASLGDRPDTVKTGSAIVWSGFIISGTMGLAGAVILVPIALQVIQRFDAHAGSLIHEIRGSVPILAFTLPAVLLQGIAVGALVARERFGVVNLIEGVGNIMTVAAPLGIAFLIGPTLPHLIAAVLVVRAIAALILIAYSARVVPLGRPVMPDRPTTLQLVGFGGWITIDGLVGTAIALWDRFVIGAMLGAASVSLYAIPSTLVMRLLIIPGALGRAFFPRLARATETQARELMADGLFALSLILAPTVVVGTALIGSFLTIWIGRVMSAQCAPIAQILFPAIYANSMASMLLALLQARNQPRKVAWLHIVEFVPYAVLLFAAIRWHGIEGAALAWSLRTIIDAVALAMMSGLHRRALLGLALPNMLIVGSAITGYAVSAASPLYWLMQLMILAMTTFCVFRQAPPQARALASALIDRVRRSRV